MAKTITKDMTIYEVLKMDENVAPIFFQFGMGCLGCPSARYESLEGAAKVHGINLDKMLEALNDYFAE